MIHLKDIIFSYPDSKGMPVLQLNDWTVTAKEKVFIQGPSGCGKSTLLNILSGILLPRQGQVTVRGQRLDTMSASKRDKFRADHIGYVFQQFNLIPYLGAIENIKLARHFSSAQKKPISLHEEIEALLLRLNIDRLNWHKPAEQLSIGQQQRIAIVRALINRPQLLIVDEPTSSLDQHNRDNFMSLLRALTDENNVTLVFVSHDTSLSQYFDRIDNLSELNAAQDK